MNTFSLDSENNEFYLLYLGYDLKDILVMDYAKSIRMSKRMQMILKLGSIHSYVNAIKSNANIDKKLKVEYPNNWKPINNQFKRMYKVEFDISDVII